MVHFQNNILNETPHFKDSFTNDLIIGQESSGNGLASPTEALQVPEDILGQSRVSSPDIGAYQHIEFE